jgi:hypothetical protein
MIPPMLRASFANNFCNNMLIKADVRFGSKADMCSAQADVRYVPKADIN